MSLDEETLEHVARDGEMDYTKWPNIVDPLLARLNHVAYNDFPIPRPYTSLDRPIEPASPTQDRAEATEQPQPNASSNTTTQALVTPVRQLPPVPLFPNSSATTTSHIPDSLPPSQSPSSSQQNALESLPVPLLQLLQSITATLRATFTSRPPHTIQRLAELILYPQNHYKTLPAWLRAVDRVVNVSSSADIFPLSEVPLQLVNGVNGDGGGGILWKNDTTSSGYDRDALGSDESLGGALLTPIPWLRNHTNESSPEETRASGGALSDDDGLGEPIELPSTGSSGRENDAGIDNGGLSMAMAGHGDPLIPEREDGAVTQGELIRMEQEAGVVPVTVTRSPRGMDEVDLDEDDHVPHARGPDVVGAVDMGKVDGKDLQVRIGSPTSEESRPGDPHEAQDLLSGSSKEESEADSMALEEDFEIVKKEGDEGEKDQMQVDDVETGETEENDEDEDIVLVDADGKMEDEDGRVGPK